MNGTDRRKRVLRAGSLQILWALLLVYCILFGVGILFGREAGYTISFGVCLGVAALVTGTFLFIHLLDRLSADGAERFRSFRQRCRERKQNSMKKIIKTTDAPPAIGPYSQAVEAGGFVFVSGQIPLDPGTGALVLGDIKEQTRRVMENAKAILSASGCVLSRVVKTTIYLANMNDFAAVNEVYGSYFPSDPPARATIEVSRLPKDVGVEMDFLASKG